MHYLFQFIFNPSVLHSLKNIRRIRHFVVVVVVVVVVAVVVVVVVVVMK